MLIGTTLRGEVPWPLTATAAVVLVAFALWQYGALRARLSLPKRILLISLRTAALALVLVLLAGPQVVRRTFHRVRRPITVAVDTSRSMSLHGGLENTRLQRVLDFLQSREYQQVAGGYQAEYAAFAGNLRSVAPAELGRLLPDGTRTDLAAALREAAVAAGTAAEVVFTDGGHVFNAKAEPLESASGLPVLFVGVGAGERNRDIEISDVDPPAIAFARQQIPITVDLRASGFSGREVPLLLKRGEQVLVSRTITLPADGQELQVILEWTPPVPGIYPLSVQIPPLEGEQILDNNRVELPIEAVRDKIRVLLVSGTPSWSYRFLRGALKGDPSLDVVSFIILRSPADAIDVPQQELSLIPFPTQKIFLEELSNFDLLIFDNFSYQPYLPVGFLEKVEEFVRAGGGFWMLGGAFSFSGGRYQSTPLAAVLPVTLAELRPPDAVFQAVPVQARLTAAGRAHPFFQGLSEREAVPPLSGYNISGPARPGAVVLAELPLTGGTAQPLIVVGRHGRGRVLAVLTDSLWTWSFEEAGRGQGNRAYLSFVRQAVRWSVGDPQLQPVRVEPERARLSPGERIRARVRVLGEDFLPAAKAELSVILRGPGGATRALAATPEETGIYRVEAEAPGEGTWEIAAEVAARGAVYGRAAATVTASWPPEEFRSPGLNREALKTLLGGRRGAYIELGTARETAETLERALDELTTAGANSREETRPVGEMVPVFLLFLALVGSEWVLRRRSGLD